MKRTAQQLFLLGLLALAGVAQADLTAITGAKVHTLGPEGTLENATVLVRDGIIEAVGVELPVPEEATVLEAEGQVLTPGLLAPISNIGLVEVSGVGSTNDQRLKDTPVGPAFSVRYGVNRFSVLFGVARTGGVTRALAAPEPGPGVFAGQGSLIRLDGAPAPVTAPDRVLVAALGERGADRAGGSRARALQSLLQGFAEARRYGRSNELSRRGLASGLSLPSYELEALERALSEKQPLWVHVDRAADIEALLVATEDLPLPLVIVGGAEAWRVGPALAAREVPVVLDPLGNLPESFDRLGARLDNATLLHEAGVTVAFTELVGHEVRELRQYAGNAVAQGLPWDVALAAITRVPAALWGEGDRLGQIAPGYRADLVLWTGDPLELTSWARWTMIEGQRFAPGSRQLQLRDRYRNPAQRVVPPGG